MARNTFQLVLELQTAAAEQNIKRFANTAKQQLAALSQIQPPKAQVPNIQRELQAAQRYVIAETERLASRAARGTPQRQEAIAARNSLQPAFREAAQRISSLPGADPNLQLLQGPDIKRFAAQTRANLERITRESGAGAAAQERAARAYIDAAARATAQVSQTDAAQRRAAEAAQRAARAAETASRASQEANTKSVTAQRRRNNAEEAAARVAEEAAQVATRRSQQQRNVPRPAPPPPPAPRQLPRTEDRLPVTRDFETEARRSASNAAEEAARDAIRQQRVRDAERRRQSEYAERESARQLQLFNQEQLSRLRVKPPEAIRYPRGYSPQRQAEARRVVDQIEFQETPEFQGPGATHAHPYAGQVGRARIVDTLASSKLDLRELVHQELKILIGPKRGGHDPSAAFLGPQGVGGPGPFPGTSLRGSQAVIALFGVPKREAHSPRDERAGAEYALLHEIGHLISELRHGRQPYGTPSERGREEAFADDFAGDALTGQTGRRRQRSARDTVARMGYDARRQFIYPSTESVEFRRAYEEQRRRTEARKLREQEVDPYEPGYRASRTELFRHDDVFEEEKPQFDMRPRTRSNKRRSYSDFDRDRKARQERIDEERLERLGEDELRYRELERQSGRRVARPARKGGLKRPTGAREAVPDDAHARRMMKRVLEQEIQAALEFENLQRLQEEKLYEQQMEAGYTRGAIGPSQPREASHYPVPRNRFPGPGRNRGRFGRPAEGRTRPYDDYDEHVRHVADEDQNLFQETAAEVIYRERQWYEEQQREKERELQAFYSHRGLEGPRARDRRSSIPRPVGPGRFTSRHLGGGNRPPTGYGRGRPDYFKDAVARQESAYAEDYLQAEIDEIPQPTEVRMRQLRSERELAQGRARERDYGDYDTGTLQRWKAEEAARQSRLGQQALFDQNQLRQLAVKPPDDIRYPRGYTPERQAEARALVDRIKIEEAPELRGSGAPSVHPFAGEDGRRRLTDALARSGINLSEIAREEIRLRLRPAGEGTGGSYERRAGVAEIDLFGRQRKPGETKFRPGLTESTQAEFSLFHEVGHLVSEIRKRESSRYDTPRRRGQEEAFADDFAGNALAAQRVRKFRQAAVRDVLPEAGYDSVGVVSRETSIEAADEFRRAYEAQRRRTEARDRYASKTSEHYGTARASHGAQMFEDVGFGNESNEIPRFDNRYSRSRFGRALKAAEAANKYFDKVAQRAETIAEAVPVGQLNLPLGPEVDREVADRIRRMRAELNRPAPGHVRLYRGEPDTGAAYGTAFSDNKGYAANFAAASRFGPGRLLQVDVPQGIADKAAEEARAKGDVGYRLPFEWADRASRVAEEKARRSVSAFGGGPLSPDIREALERERILEALRSQRPVRDVTPDDSPSHQGSTLLDQAYADHATRQYQRRKTGLPSQSRHEERAEYADLLRQAREKEEVEFNSHYNEISEWLNRPRPDILGDEISQKRSTSAFDRENQVREFARRLQAARSVEKFDNLTDPASYPGEPGISPERLRHVRQLANAPSPHWQEFSRARGYSEPQIENYARIQEFLEQFSGVTRDRTNRAFGGGGYGRRPVVDHDTRSPYRDRTPQEMLEYGRTLFKLHDQELAEAAKTLRATEEARRTAEQIAILRKRSVSAFAAGAAPPPPSPPSPPTPPEEPPEEPRRVFTVDPQGVVTPPASLPRQQYLPPPDDAHLRAKEAYDAINAGHAKREAQARTQTVRTLEELAQDAKAKLAAAKAIRSVPKRQQALRELQESTITDFEKLRSRIPEGPDAARLRQENVAARQAALAEIRKLFPTAEKYRTYDPSVQLLSGAEIGGLVSKVRSQPAEVSPVEQQRRENEKIKAARQRISDRTEFLGLPQGPEVPDAEVLREDERLRALEYARRRQFREEFAPLPQDAARARFDARRRSGQERFHELDYLADPEYQASSAILAAKESRVGVQQRIANTKEVTPIDIREQAELREIRARQAAQERGVYAAKAAADGEFVRATVAAAANEARLAATIDHLAAVAQTGEHNVVLANSARAVQVQGLRQEIIQQAAVAGYGQAKLRSLAEEVGAIQSIATLQARERTIQSEVNRTRVAASRAEHQRLAASGGAGGGASLFQRAFAFSRNRGNPEAEPIDPASLPQLGAFLTGKAITTAGFAASGALLYGSVRTIKEMITNAEELELVMGQLEQQMISTGQGGQFKDVRSDIIGIATDTGEAVVEVARLYQRLQGLFGSLGNVSQGQITQEVRSATQIGLVTGLPEAQIKDNAAAFATNYGALSGVAKEGEVAVGGINETLGDLTVTIENKFGVAAAEMIGFLGDIAPVAKEAGFSMQEFGAIAAVASQTSGKSASAVAESLGRVIPRFQQSITQILAIPGLANQVSDEALQSALGPKRNIAPLFFEVRKVYRDLPGGPQRELQKALGGTRETQNILGLLNRSEEQFQKDLASLSADEIRGALSDRAEKQAESLSRRIARLGQEFQKLGDAIYNLGLGDFLKNLLLIVGTPLSWFAELLHFAAELNETLGGLPTKILALYAALRLVGGLGARGLTALGAIGAGARVGAGAQGLVQGAQGVVQRTPFLQSAAIGAAGLTDRVGATALGSRVASSGIVTGLRNRLPSVAPVVPPLLTDNALDSVVVAPGDAAANQAKKAAAGVTAAGIYSKIAPALTAAFIAIEIESFQRERIKGSAAKGVDAKTLTGEIRKRNRSFNPLDLIDNATSGGALDGAYKEQIAQLSDEELNKFLRLNKGDKKDSLLSLEYGETGRKEALKEQSKRKIVEATNEGLSSQLSEFVGVGGFTKNDFDDLQDRLLSGDEKAYKEALAKLAAYKNGSKAQRAAYAKGVKDLQELKILDDPSTDFLSPQTVGAQYEVGDKTFSQYLTKLQQQALLAKRQIAAARAGGGHEEEDVAAAAVKTQKDLDDAVATYAKKVLDEANAIIQIFGANDRTGLADVRARLNNVNLTPVDRTNILLEFAKEADKAALDRILASYNTDGISPEQRKRFAKEYATEAKAAFVRRIAAAPNEVEAQRIGNEGYDITPVARDLPGQRRSFGTTLSNFFKGRTSSVRGYLTAEENVAAAEKVAKEARENVEIDRRIFATLFSTDSVDLANLAVRNAENALALAGEGTPEKRSAEAELAEKRRAQAEAVRAREKARQGLATARIPSDQPRRAAEAALANAKDELTAANATRTAADPAGDEDRIIAALTEYANAQKGYLEGLKAQFAQDAADANAIDELFASSHSKDTQLILQRAVATATSLLTKAKSTGDDRTVRSAVVALNAANNALADYAEQLASAQSEYAVSVASLGGFPVQAAQERVNEAQRLFVEAAKHKDTDPLAFVNATRALGEAKAAAVDAFVADAEADIEFGLDFNELSAGQAVAKYQALLPLYAGNKEKTRDILRKIKALKDASSADLQFNTPQDVLLPTIYEVRRFSKTESSGSGYQDNRQISVVFHNNNATDYQGAIDKFTDLIDRSGGVYGTRERPY